MLIMLLYIDIVKYIYIYVYTDNNRGDGRTDSNNDEQRLMGAMDKRTMIEKTGAMTNDGGERGRWEEKS